MPTLIGINGFKTSGKDTTYSILSDVWGDGFVQRAAFADKLKIAAASALGLEGTPQELIALMDECKDSWAFHVARQESIPDLIPENGTVDDALGAINFTSTVTKFTGRQYLQWFGGKLRDVFGENFWIDQVLPYPATEVIDGLTWEADDPGEELPRWYPDADCVAITDARYPNEAKRIKELGGVMWEVIRPGLESDGHDSEVPLPRELVDWQIVNDGDLDVLRDRIQEAVNETC